MDTMTDWSLIRPSTPLRPLRLRSGLVAGWAASKPATLSPLFLSTYLWVLIASSILVI